MTISSFVEYILNLENLIGNRLPFMVHKLQIYIYTAKTNEKKKKQLSWENMLMN